MPLEDYEIIGRIGSGKYASVYRIRRLADGALLAMKKIQLTRLSPRERTNALSEVRLLSAICHPNIVTLLEVFFDEFIETLCLVLELAQEGDLSVAIEQKIERREIFSQEEVWGIIEQVSRGLQFLHSHGIMHRDIKASNILIFSNGVVKIGDLNVSKLDNGLSYTRTGTLTYASPQIWKGERYDCKSDIWSFGCLLYEMLCLRKPFEGENLEIIFKRISKGQYDKISTDAYSRGLKDLPTYMLQLNPKLRPSAATLCKIAKNKGKYAADNSQCTVSFNLASIVIPGLEALVQSSDPYLLQANTSLQCGLMKRKSVSRHKQYLTPIPPTLKGTIREPELIRQTKSRYNCKNLSKLPSFHIENNTNLPEISKQDLNSPLNNPSNQVFKRLGKKNKLKLLRRHTEL